MNTKQQVKELLKTVYDAGDVNAMHIWKGFSATTGETGWHFQEFGRSEHHYMGKSVAEVQQYVDEVEIERDIAEDGPTTADLAEADSYGPRWEIEYEE